MKLTRLAATILVLTSSLMTSCSSLREGWSESGRTMRSWVGMDESEEGEADTSETEGVEEAISVLEEEKAVVLGAADEAKAELRARLDEMLQSFTSEWAEIAGDPSAEESSPVALDRAFVMRAVIGAMFNPEASEGVPAEEAALVQLALTNPGAVQDQLLLALYADLVRRQAEGHQAEAEVLELLAQIQQKLAEPSPESGADKR